ncbi:MAG: hypothetical protein KBT28_06935 [Bacteroidales bacterium]|nr:hypothetical protein [Candidatus Colimorpha merdihippi]
MKKTIVMCPNCGTQFAIAQHEYTTVATVIGEDSNLGVIKLTPKDEQTPIDDEPVNVPRSTSKLEEMKRLGMPVDNFFSVSNPDVGIDFIARKRDDGSAESFTSEQIEQLIQQYIRENGHIRNSRLFRRWIMSQVCHMLASPNGFLASLRNKGYEYSWRMVIKELETVAKLRLRDRDAFLERKRFFPKEVIVAMAEDVLAKMHADVDAARTRKCKRRAYKRVYGRNIFISELDAKLFQPVERALETLKNSTSKSLYANACAFNNIRPSFRYDAPMCHDFENAYKAAGAYYSLKNLILFHNVKMVDADNNLIQDTDQALAYLDERATLDCNNHEGYKLMGLLKSVMERNHFDFNERMKQLGVRR